MRTLYEIVQAVKHGQPTTHDECRIALLCSQALLAFASSSLRDLADIPRARPFVEEDFRRVKSALDTDALKWLGWNNNPDNPEYRRRVALAERLFDKVVKAAEVKP